MTNWYINKDNIIKCNSNKDCISDNSINEVYDSYSMAVIKLKSLS